MLIRVQHTHTHTQSTGSRVIHTVFITQEKWVLHQKWALNYCGHLKQGSPTHTHTHTPYTHYRCLYCRLTHPHRDLHWGTNEILLHCPKNNLDSSPLSFFFFHFFLETTLPPLHSSFHPLLKDSLILPTFHSPVCNPPPCSPQLGMCSNPGCPGGRAAPNHSINV